jgi:hypothetical protein
MSVCVHKCNGKKNLLRNASLQRIRKINLKYYLNKSEIDKIMQFILIDFCSTTVLGYDRLRDKYWCKKYNKSSCVLHLEININNKGLDCSEINIEPLLYSTSDLEMFLMDFSESIQMYKTSNFIRCIMFNR